jgi:hypothetical protein
MDVCIGEFIGAAEKGREFIKGNGASVTHVRLQDVKANDRGTDSGVVGRE